MSSKGAIGVFDSGVGGLTVLKEIVSLLPNEKTLYLGDTARVPYGSKPQKTIIEYSLEDATYLTRQNVTALVVACNTICCLAMTDLEKAFELPIIGVIGPASRAAVNLTKNRRVGIIATEGTINSGVYQQAIKQLDSKIEIFPKACPLFVPIVEENVLEGVIAEKIVAMYLTELKEKQLDILVLGCTHYPLLMGPITRFMGSKVTVLDPATAVAQELKQKLTEYKLRSDSKTEGSHKFFFTGQPQKAEKLIRRLNIRIDSIEQANLAAPPVCGCS